jgi:hypothetical protein
MEVGRAVIEGLQIKIKDRWPKREEERRKS